MRHDVEDGAGTAVAERTGRKAGAPALNKEEIQRKMEEADRPGPAHKALDALAGNWKAEVKCWYEPGRPPEVTQGTAKTQWILNGRFLEEEFHGQSMGKKFTGKCILGFDNTRQRYQMIWINDLWTATFVTEGKGDEKVITLEGKSDCPATGQRDVPTKCVYRLLSADKHVFEMFDGSKGNAKSMEITYTRA